MQLNSEFILNKLVEKFGDSVILYSETQYDILSINIDSSQNTNVVDFLYNDNELAFKFLTDLTGAHYPEKKGNELCVVYHLYNMQAKFRLRLKADLPIENPEIKSLYPIFSGADWMERETYDFFGINFLGHPNLIRILNTPEMDYFPLRKEYPLEDQSRKDKDDAMFGR